MRACVCVYMCFLVPAYLFVFVLLYVCVSFFLFSYVCFRNYFGSNIARTNIGVRVKSFRQALAFQDRLLSVDVTLLVP